MKRSAIAIVLAVGATALLGGSAANAAASNTAIVNAGSDVGARKKMKRTNHRSMDRMHRESYGYQRSNDRPYPRQGYYRNVQPGYGYGPDYGDRAWPPFHFRPYY